jgi:arylsulfatase A-like enzyme
MPKLPNILLLMTDQQALHAVGCYGAPLCRTPAIDALAQDGVRFTESRSPCALCAPARATMLTGLYPHRHGIIGNIEIDRPDLVCFPQRLAQQGYNLGYSGKWHAGLVRTANDMGFEGFGPQGYGSPYGPQYDAWLARKGLEKPGPVIEFYAEGEPMRALGDSSGYLNGPTEACPPAFTADLAIELLTRFAQQDRPFLMICSFWEPHAPYLPSNDYKDTYSPADIPPWASFADDLANRPVIHRKHREVVFPNAAHAGWDTWSQVVARYYGLATEVDAHIGRVVTALKTLGLYEDTFVVYTTDHGETVGIHGGAFDKGSMPYEEVYRTPLIVKLPGNQHAGTTRSQRVSLLDFAATFCELAQTELPPTDGASFVPALYDPHAPGREHFVAEFHGHRFPVAQRIIWWQQYKYVLNFADIDELYDLSADPAELHNRIAEPALVAVRDEMRRRLLEHMRAVDDTHGPQWEYILDRPFQG